MPDIIKKELITRAGKVKSRVDKNAPPIVLLTEGDDERVRHAAREMTTLGLARVVLLVSEDFQPDPHFDEIKVISLQNNNYTEEFASDLFHIRREKGLSKQKAREFVRLPLYFGAMFLRAGYADAAVSGAMHTTADVFRTGVQILRTDEDIRAASSFFLMVLPDGKVFTYADCGVIPYPSKDELVDITIAAAGNHRKLTGENPRVALLSFSTKGSAKHEKVDFVNEVLSAVKARDPELCIDGELQFDAAFDSKVAERKAPGSPVAGAANVYIFPNLDAGNIAYKITERTGGATALGPILQGLSKPWMDLSRGCSAEDILLVGAIGIIMGM